MQGVSFKKGEHSFKGSDVDRMFSYGKLNLQLSEHKPVQEERQEDRQQNKYQPSLQQAEPPKETESSVAENIASAVGNALSAAGGLFNIQPANHDENQAEYLSQQALKKKKKPQKRRGIRR